MNRDQILDVPVPRENEQLGEVPGSVSQNKILQHAREQTLDFDVPLKQEEGVFFFQDKVQQPLVEQIIGVCVFRDSVLQRTVEQFVESPVTQEEFASQDKVMKWTTQERVNERIVEVPVPYLREETVEVMKLVPTRAYRRGFR